MFILCCHHSPPQMKQTLSLFNYSFKNQSDDTIDIYIDGIIVDAPTQAMLKSWYGDETSTSYKSLRDQINQSSAKKVNIYINSGGGMVADAMAIHDMIVDLQNKGTQVNTFGRGIIASAATYILMASKNSDISENSWFMIHNVQGGAWGDVNDIENAGKMMRKFNNQIRDLYANYTSLPSETISAYMNKETWFTGKEAKEKGFVKNVSGNAQFKNSIKSEQWNFENTTVLNSYNSFTQENTSDMKISLDSIKETVKNALAEMFPKTEDAPKVENAATAICTSIENALKPVTDQIDTHIATTVANLLKADGEGSVQAMITTTLSNILKAEGEGTVSAAIVVAANSAVATATNGFAKTSDLETLKTDVAGKLGNKVGEGQEQESEGERKINNKRGFFQVGNFVK